MKLIKDIEPWVFETTRWAVEHDCYDGQVETCDGCGKKTCQLLAGIWNVDCLVCCEDCAPAQAAFRRQCFTKTTPLMEVPNNNDGAKKEEV